MSPQLGVYKGNGVMLYCFFVLWIGRVILFSCAFIFSGLEQYRVMVDGLIGDLSTFYCLQYGETGGFHEIEVGGSCIDNV